MQTQSRMWCVQTCDCLTALVSMYLAIQLFNATRHVAWKQLSTTGEWNYKSHSDDPVARKEKKKKRSVRSRWSNKSTHQNQNLVTRLKTTSLSEELMRYLRLPVCFLCDITKDFNIDTTSGDKNLIFCKCGFKMAHFLAACMMQLKPNSAAEPCVSFCTTDMTEES